MRFQDIIYIILLTLIFKYFLNFYQLIFIVEKDTTQLHSLGIHKHRSLSPLQHDLFSSRRIPGINFIEELGN
jgi:hypothetical protein